MPSSFIEFKGSGFWARDGFVEAFQLLLFEEITSECDHQTSWLNDYRKTLAQESLLQHGAMSMYLDDFLTDQEREETLAALVKQIKQHITSNRDYLTGNRLNSLQRQVREFLVATGEFDWDAQEIEKQLRDNRYGEALPTQNYVRGFELLEKLITGQLPFKTDTPVTYWHD